METEERVVNGFKPRCWARRASDGALCESMSDGRHDTDSGDLVHWATIAEGKTGVWFEDDCAPNAGPDGRETAALRIWEIGTQIDLLALLQREHSRLVAMLRAMSARLLVSADAAREDLAEIEREIHDGRCLRDVVVREKRQGEHPDVFAWLEDTLALLQFAAELLRPFAEGGR